MRRSRGVKLGRKMVRVFRWFNISRRASPRTALTRLGSRSCTVGAVSKLFRWGRSLTHGAKALCFAKRRSGYIQLGQEQVLQSKDSVSVPKGHLAVYVGEDDDDTCRVVVPVIYFNHPLFADLLRDAEKVYGFDHPGGIQIPCQKSEFEDVKMKIAAASGGGNGGNCRGRRSWRKLLMTSRYENFDH